MTETTKKTLTVKELVTNRVAIITDNNQQTSQPRNLPLAQSAAIQNPATVFSGLPSMNKIENIRYAIDRNEDADAELFALFNADKCRFDYDEGSWYVFNGSYWERDFNNRVMKFFKDIIACYESAYTFLKSKKSDKYKGLLDDIKLRIKQLSSLSRKKNVLAIATGDLGISSAEWDRDLMSLGFENGILDLRTGTFRNGEPEDLIRTVCPVAWKGMKEPCPHWEAYISTIFVDDVDTVSFIQRLLGSSIAGEIREHIFTIFFGQGRNGKGILLETVKSVLGDYAFKIKSSFLLSQKIPTQSGAADADVKSLKGKRLIFASETSRSGALDESKIKELVGGDALNARSPFERRSCNFDPTHTLFLMTNHKPNVSSDFAFWERAILVDFPLSFVTREPVAPNERKADLGLKKKLLEEASGIAAWLVQGCLNWQELGLKPPASVIAATQEYKEEEDILGNFVSDTCEVAADKTEQANTLYAAYSDWCSFHGFRVFSNKAFGKELKKKFKSIRTGSGVIYYGIRVINTLNK